MELTKFKVGETFGIDAPAAATVPGYKMDESAPWAQFVPETDPDYVFSSESFRDLNAWWNLTNVPGMLESEGFLAFGPKGTGKTSLILQVAARLNIPVIEITGHGRLEVDDLLGRNTIVDGDILFQDGPFTTAARLGTWVLVNEIDAMDPSQQVGLNSLAERRSFMIPQTGEIVEPHPNFRFLATANTNMGGDSEGSFAGVQRQNSAFADRFMFSEVDYPDAKTEQSILESTVPGVKDDWRKIMVEFANDIRNLYKEGGIDVVLSTRSLIRWAKLTQAFSRAQGLQSPVKYAMLRAFGLQADVDSRTLLEERLKCAIAEEG